MGFKKRDRCDKSLSFSTAYSSPNHPKWGLLFREQPRPRILSFGDQIGDVTHGSALHVAVSLKQIELELGRK